MKKIKIFLASSNELVHERQQFEREIYRKTKKWFKKGVFLHLDIWEDLSARISENGSQSEYNKSVKKADLFVLLAYSKVGMYTNEEFETAFGEFQAKKKPFLFIYFKDIDSGKQESLENFKEKLKSLNHFYGTYSNFDNLWNQFNKELDLLIDVEFNEHVSGLQLFEEKNVVHGPIKNAGNVRIGDKECSKIDQYKYKDVVRGGVENVKDFTLGDGH